MKKYILSSIAILALVSISCKKQEILQPNEDESNPKQNEEQVFTPLVITAVVDDDVTKTTYTDMATYYQFAWEGDEYVSVQVFKGGSPLTPDQIKFRAQSAGASTTLVQDGNNFDLSPDHNVEGYGTVSKDGYTLGDYAFYPKYAEASSNDLLYVRNASGSGDGDSSSDYVKLYEEIPYVNGNPASIIPIIGYKQSGDGTPNTVFKFKTATGVLKISVKNIPAGAVKMRLASLNSADVLSGEWYMSEDLYTNGITMTDGVKGNTSSTKTVTFSGLDSQDKDFYIPIPAGTIHGLNIDFLNSNGNLIYRTSTSADIAIARNVIKELTEVNLTTPSRTIAFSVSGTSASPSISFTKSNIKRVCVTVTSSATNDLSAYLTGLHFENDNVTYAISTWDASHTALLADKSTGLFYMHYVAITESVNASDLTSLNDKRIKFYGSVPFYYLDATSVTKYIGQYDITYGTDSSTTLTLTASDNPSKGNIMLTEFAGTSGKLYGVYGGAENSMNLVFSNSYNVAFTASTYIYSGNNNLNFCLGYTRTDQANYESKAWDLIGWNAYVTYEVVGGSTTSYAYVRGNKN